MVLGYCSYGVRASFFLCIVVILHYNIGTIVYVMRGPKVISDRDEDLKSDLLCSRDYIPASAIFRLAV